MSKALFLGAAVLALSAGAASAQGVYPGYGYNGATIPLYDYAAPAYAPAADFAPPAYGYAAPAYGYAAPAYSAPAQPGTTVVIVTPAPAYTAPVTSGYYAAPSTVVSQPIYNYAPGYGYDYTPGYWNRGYWGRWGR